MAILISAAEEVIMGEEQEEESNVSSVEALILPMPAPITSDDVQCSFSRNKVWCLLHVSTTLGELRLSTEHPDDFGSGETD